jgi:hypothetical protein
MLLGGALLVRALQSRRKGRTLLYALGGAGLVAFGIRKRRHTGEPTLSPLGTSATGTPEQRPDSHQIDINPRGTTDESDVETKTDPDEGPIQFTEDRPEEPRTEPDLDEPVPGDPRLDDDDGVTEIDLSEAAMADEASEAVGPAPEQAQPVQTEETEPEPTPAADSSQTDADQGPGNGEENSVRDDDVGPDAKSSDSNAASNSSERKEATGEASSEEEDTDTD